MRTTSRFFLFLAILLAVLIGSLVPHDPLAQGSHVFDKVEHFGAYAILMVVGAWAARGRHKAIAALLIALGLTIEFGQSWMHLGREGSVLDAVANTLGVAVGWMVVRVWFKRS
jgi:VanZ family protein